MKIEINGSLFAKIFCWVTFVFALISIAIFGFIASERHFYERIFEDFKIDLPNSTRLIFSIPGKVIFAAAGLTAIMVFAVQFSVRSRLAAAVFHLLVVVVCTALFFFSLYVMSRPIMGLTEGIQTH